MSRPTVVGTRDHLFFVGEVSQEGNLIKIKYPLSINLQPGRTEQEIYISITVYPPALSKLVDDMTDFTITLTKEEVRFIKPASDQVAEQWEKGSNAFRNIAQPTTGEIIDITTESKEK